MRFSLPLAGILLLCAIPAFAIDYDDSNWKLVDPEIVRECQRVETIPVPPGDRPNATQARALKDCDAQNLYYGAKSVRSDTVKARHCALLGLDSGYGSPDILTMIYANGYGVSRNIDLALRFSCELEGSAAEVEGRSHALLNLRDSVAKDPFDICDYATSSHEMGRCSLIAEGPVERSRENRLSSLTASWSPDEKKRLGELRKAFDAFVDLRTFEEIRCGCSNYLVYSSGEESVLNNRFVAEIAQFEAAKWFPNFSEAQFIQSDRELNRLYRKIVALRLRENPGVFWGDITVEGVKKTQRAWLKYRDAYVALGKARYPKVTEQAWKTWLTRKRVTMLQEIFEQMVDTVEPSK